LTDTRLALERGDTRLKRLCVPIGLRALLMVYSNLRAASAHKQPPLEGADREQLLRDWAGARDWALRRMYGEHVRPSPSRRERCDLRLQWTEHRCGRGGVGGAGGRRAAGC
jgi:hypothetical protein